jgi:2-keto-4-pentenoate hydratase/2-oxohepta-3-ene-1,7-dioic acid hydratase in catechol pathway
MRLANLNERLAVIVPDGMIDVERASGGRFAADPQAAFERWDELVAWAGGDLDRPESYAAGDLRAPVPRPRQVFALALNYAKHAAEGGREVPTTLLTFTKFPTCLTGTGATVALATDSVDWEVELVAVIGRRAHRVSVDEAWSHVAGVTVGQDLSARDVQHAGSPPQFSLGKSFPGFGPIGPWLVTPDELPDRDDLAIGCVLNGEQVQDGRTSQMVFPVGETISRLSHVCPLLPGDLVFTGTPSGVGNAREPKWFLKPGDELLSTIEGVGTITTHFEARHS